MSQSRNQTSNSLSAATLAGDRRSRFGLAGSLALHAAVVAATLFTWQHSLEITDESPPVVPVELVTIGDKTNIKPAEVKTEDFKPTKEDEPIAAPKVNEATPPPEQMQTPKVEMAPPPKAEPPPPEEAAPELTAKPKPAPPMPKQRPKPPAPEKKKAKFDVNNILALLDKKQPASRSARSGTAKQARKGIGAQDAMTMDLVDALRNQIAQCWSPPVGAPHPEDLIVSYEVFLNPDGSVAQPPQLTGQSSGSNAYMRAAQEAARRAIYTCAPYKLPADRFGQWRDITLTFDPRHMLGQ